jgi:hypothetical protein
MERRFFHSSKSNQTPWGNYVSCDCIFSECSGRLTKQQFAVKGGHFIKENLGVFDARFFSISPEEAMAMDPHQRIILEETYRAFENGNDLCSLFNQNS